MKETVSPYFQYHFENPKDNFTKGNKKNDRFFFKKRVILVPYKCNIRKCLGCEWPGCALGVQQEFSV